MNLSLTTHVIVFFFHLVISHRRWRPPSLIDNLACVDARRTKYKIFYTFKRFLFIMWKSFFENLKKFLVILPILEKKENSEFASQSRLPQIGYYPATYATYSKCLAVKFSESDHQLRRDAQEICRWLRSLIHCLHRLSSHSLVRKFWPLLCPWWFMTGSSAVTSSCSSGYLHTSN